MEYDEIEFFGLLSKEEFFRLNEAVRRDGKIDEAEAERLTDWAMKQLTNATIVNLMIDGYLSVERWDENGEPQTVPTNDAIEFMTNFDVKDLPKLEESRCF